MAQRALAAKAVFILSIAFVLPLVARASALPAIAQQPTPESAPQATPTPDATATVLQKEKLTQEVEQLRRQNGRGWFWANGSALATSVLTALVAVAVAIFGFMQWRGNQREARAQRTEEQGRWLTDRETEREKRADERFQEAVEGLGSTGEQARVGAAVTLLTFLRPGYEQFYTQVVNLAVANLRLLSAMPAGEAMSESPTPLVQAFATVFAEAFPRAREYLRQNLESAYSTHDESEHLHGKESIGLEIQRVLDASGVQLEKARLHQTDLSRAWMLEANLRRANLAFTHLEGAVLGDADLTDANLRHAFLSNANLTRAVLDGANLREADLTGADLTDTHPERARSLVGAMMSSVTGLDEEQRKACAAKGAFLEDHADNSETPAVPAAAQPPAED